jgi:hypothetical protein
MILESCIVRKSQLICRTYQFITSLKHNYYYFVGLSYSSEKSVSLVDYVANASDDTTLVFVVCTCE